MQGGTLLKAIQEKIARQSTDAKMTNRAVAEWLGVTQMNLWHWRNAKNITPLQIANLIQKARESAAGAAERQAIRPIVEFFEIHRVKSRDGDYTELFDPRRGASAHPYLRGLKSELEKSHGVYIFYDSRGHALYVGKARQQFLWAEMRNAFNRHRGDLQQIKRVDHPSSKKQFSTSYEQKRQIRHQRVPLSEMTEYISAYGVSDGLIGELESLLVRGFANDILNKRMEQFGGEKPGRSKKRRKRAR